MTDVSLEKLYTVGSSEKVKSLEAELEREIAELKAEIEENQLVHGVVGRDFR